jgi:hypothetical protein
MFGQAVEYKSLWYKYMTFGLCNILTALDSPPRSKGYFVRISMVTFVLKGVNTRQVFTLRKIGS